MGILLFAGHVFPVNEKNRFIDFTRFPLTMQVMDVKTISDYFRDGGKLSKSIPGFENRPEQLTMAEAVGRSLIDGGHLMVEAGTGTGKSMAYLLPAILWAVENDKTVVVSTYTKTLQDQIVRHDIPLLRQRLGLSFRYALCLGHENYLSLRRLKRARQTGMFNDSREESQLGEIFSWVSETATGLKTELPFEPLPSVWEEVGRHKDLCMGKNCESYTRCFYFKERKKWFGAHLLVVNHHLFFANIASNGGVLPRFDAVVFDEAQNIEEAATSFLGLELSNSGMFYFLDRLYNAKTHKGTLARLKRKADDSILSQVMTVREEADRFFQNLFDEYGQGERTLRFYKPPKLENNIHSPLQDLLGMLKDLEGKLESDEDRLEVSAAGTRCFEFDNCLSVLLNHHMEEYVYWLEIAARKRYSRAVLRGVPIDLSAQLRSQVFDNIDRVVLTSATLTANKRFDFIKTRIGYEPSESLVLDGPFDFPSQALLYIPTDLPGPDEETGKYVSAMARRIRELIHVSDGKTFILFTSYELLNGIYKILEPLLPEYPLLKQGDLPPARMIREFKESPSVIFGTSSFWQGVDIPGEALSNVIITKLPFDVPTEPLIEARMEDLRKKSINPFQNYQIPRAIINLRQGFGRLIRKKTDRGIVAILDSRMVTRSYGKQFIASLPNCPVVEDLAQVKKFFSEAARFANPRLL